jgi:hypothetical protein
MTQTTKMTAMALRSRRWWWPSSRPFSAASPSLRLGVRPPSGAVPGIRGARRPLLHGQAPFRHAPNAVITAGVVATRHGPGGGRRGPWACVRLAKHRRVQR